MTGHVSVLPPLTGNDCPGTYVCAILTGDDLDVPAPSDFFRALLVYTREGWWPEDESQAANMLGGPRHCGRQRGLLADAPQGLWVRLDGGPSVRTVVCTVPYRPEHVHAGEHVLGTSRGFMERKEVTTIKVTIEIRLFETQTAAGGEWEGFEHALVMHQATRHCGRQHI
jgi:hypothetical protein